MLNSKYNPDNLMCHGYDYENWHEKESVNSSVKKKNGELNDPCQH